MPAWTEREDVPILEEGIGSKELGAVSSATLEGFGYYYFLALIKTFPDFHLKDAVNVGAATATAHLNYVPELMSGLSEAEITARKARLPSYLVWDASALTAENFFAPQEKFVANDEDHVKWRELFTGVLAELVAFAGIQRFIFIASQDTSLNERIRPWVLKVLKGINTTSILNRPDEAPQKVHEFFAPRGVDKTPSFIEALSTTSTR